MVKLGDKVRDPISGFEGVAVSSHHFLYGCDRISVQPPIDKDGHLPDVQSFDAPQLEVRVAQIAKGDPMLPGGRPGGPDKC